MNNTQLKELLITTITHAGALLKNHYYTGFSIHTKQEHDIVTEADHASEQAILTLLKPTSYAILCEETGNHAAQHTTKNTAHIPSQTADYLWIVDPLDGTRNFANNIPFFNISIALAFKGEIILGAVYDPLHDELYIAEKGKGATCNGKPISVLETPKHLTLISCGPTIATKVKERLKTNLRAYGSVALELSYVACGKLQGIANTKVSAWDFAAGWLILEEAGAKTSDLDGKPLTLTSKNILAATPQMYPLLVAAVKK